jgi:hypothetical protein
VHRGTEDGRLIQNKDKTKTLSLPLSLLEGRVRPLPTMHNSTSDSGSPPPRKMFPSKTATIGHTNATSHEPLVQKSRPPGPDSARTSYIQKSQSLSGLGGGSLAIPPSPSSLMDTRYVSTRSPNDTLFALPNHEDAGNTKPSIPVWQRKRLPAASASSLVSMSNDPVLSKLLKGSSAANQSDSSQAEINSLNAELQRAAVKTDKSTWQYIGRVPPSMEKPALRSIPLRPSALPLPPPHSS